MIGIVERGGVLDAEQCACVVEQYRAALQPSTVTGAGHAERFRSGVRTSASCKVPRHSFRADVGLALLEALHSVVGASDELVEPWELLHYGLGGQYRAHVDWLAPAMFAKAYAYGGQRTHSVIIYLNHVQAGGELVFTRLKRAVVPELGKMVAWNNLVDGRVSHDAMHEARPVLAGEKWALVTWVRERSPYASADHVDPSVVSQHVNDE